MVTRRLLGLSPRKTCLRQPRSLSQSPPKDNAVCMVNLQLVGVIAMHTASRYEEILHSCVGDFSCVTDQTCSKVHIHQIETKILKALDFSLEFPLPLHCRRRPSKIAEVLRVVPWNLSSEQMMESGFTSSSASSLITLGWIPSGPIDLCHFCNATQLRLKVTVSQLSGTAKNIINVNQCAAQQKAVVKKYATVQQSPSLGMLKKMCENDT
ncbi:hypothetical protein HGM15179_004751 [Zosterops borbonicus]|uniref:Cyclin N-terminal domain-containing protein n=1 Tax=Zosterops borbonicus TaxID=364589 RepID=A0A8K1GNL7_9PASS|nr:hypothetical protein HGM15179_004751 [Zosterops borbonicus]